MSGRAAAARRHNLFPVKKRLDVLLVERGLAESRAQAQALVMAGLVHGFDKPGTPVEESTALALAERPRYVSRGGEKLEHALEAFGVDVAGRSCLDVGASTGGFTDCLLQRGAAHVVALDVAYGELHLRIREDPRVTVLERVNARALACEQLPYRPDLVAVDVSFISLTKVLPAVLACTAERFDCLAMVKPQFEVGRGLVGKGGVVKDAAMREEAVLDVARAAQAEGCVIAGVSSSGLPGPSGNREVFLWLAEAGRAPVADLAAAVAEAV